MKRREEKSHIGGHTRRPEQHFGVAQVADELWPPQRVCRATDTETETETVSLLTLHP